MADRKRTRKQGGSAKPGVAALPKEALRRRFDPARFPFKTTAKAESVEGVLGQDRAVAAIEFGIGIKRPGYNLFALGPPGTGRHTLVREFLERAAAAEPVPPDLCYVNNFSDPRKPKLMVLPAGRAGPLHDAMDQLVRELRTALPAVFESEDYRARRQLIEGEFKRRQEEIFEALQTRAKERDIALMRTPVGLMFAPVRDGEVIKPEEFEKLPASRRTSKNSRGSSRNRWSRCLPGTRSSDRKSTSSTAS
jgi:Lon-like LonC helical domain